MHLSAFAQEDRMPLQERLLQLNWIVVLLLCLIAGVGVAMLYSAAGGRWDPWAVRHLIRFALALTLMLAVAMTDIRVWMRYAYAIYGVVLALLVVVEISGAVGMGAQRWINLGLFNLQPSELMKITLVLALARYFHSASLEDVARPTFLLPPILLLGAPVALVLRQPDLGTALVLMMGAAAVFFVVGVRMWKFALVGAAGLGTIPIVWSMLHTYQRKRILTFINPESDPLGAGYHILQSKIALGSGGMFGKGYMQGTQSHLSFLPEMQTDFIFTMLAEEFGLFGGLALIGLYMLLIGYGYYIALRARHQFGRVLGMGLASALFLYLFINIAMVMGLVPVVGVPLPLISYGGTAMISVMFGFGLLLSAAIDRDVEIGRHSSFDDL